MKYIRTMALAALVAIATGPAVRAQDEKKPGADPEAFLREYVSGLTIGEGLQAEQIFLFPILALEAPPAVGVKPDNRTADLEFVELEKPKKPFNIGISNRSDDPVLVPGGTVLVGGHLDRLIPVDLVIPAKHQVEVETLPAEYPRDSRKEAAPFRRGTSLAPVFVRERGANDPSRNLVPVFVSHFLEFRNPGDERHSLQAIDDSALLATYCIECQRATAEFPDIAGGRVVGFVTAVRGRIHDLELFGTNDLLRAWFNPILRAHTYAAAAVALRAEKVGMPLPETDREREIAMKLARADAEKLLAALKEDVKIEKREAPAGSEATMLGVRTERARGFAVGRDGRLLHAVLFPTTPFEEALFSRPIEPPPEGSGSEESLGELERRADRGTLTEFEKRLLDRMRERRQPKSVPKDE